MVIDYLVAGAGYTACAPTVPYYNFAFMSQWCIAVFAEVFVFAFQCSWPKIINLQVVLLAWSIK